MWLRLVSLVVLVSWVLARMWVDGEDTDDVEGEGDDGDRVLRLVLGDNYVLRSWWLVRCMVCLRVVFGASSSFSSIFLNTDMDSFLWSKFVCVRSACSRCDT